MNNLKLLLKFLTNISYIDITDLSNNIIKAEMDIDNLAQEEVLIRQQYISEEVDKLNYEITWGDSMLAPKAYIRIVPN